MERRRWLNGRSSHRLNFALVATLELRPKHTSTHTVVTSSLHRLESPRQLVAAALRKRRNRVKSPCGFLTKMGLTG